MTIFCITNYCTQYDNRTIINNQRIHIRIQHAYKYYGKYADNKIYIIYIYILFRILSRVLDIFMLIIILFLLVFFCTNIFLLFYFDMFYKIVTLLQKYNDI